MYNTENQELRLNGWGQIAEQEVMELTFPQEHIKNTSTCETILSLNQPEPGKRTLG